MAVRAPSHPLVELTMVRFREFLREPEAIFWVFAFPIIMTCALGMAFRSSGEEPVIVGVVQTPGSEATCAALERAGGFTVRPIAPDDIERAVRDGRAPVVVDAGHAAVVPLRRGARREPGGAARRRRGAAAGGRAARRLSAGGASGRSDWLALHRLARPRPPRHEHHEHGPVGRRLLDCHGAHEEAAQAARRDADVAHRTISCLTCSTGSSSWSSNRPS